MQNPTPPPHFFPESHQKKCSPLHQAMQRAATANAAACNERGNAMSERSSGSNFSPRQREAMKQMRHGKRFYISRVKATGPDGVTRDIAPMEVIVN